MAEAWRLAATAEATVRTDGTLSSTGYGGTEGAVRLALPPLSGLRVDASQRVSEHCAYVPGVPAADT